FNPVFPMRRFSAAALFGLALLASGPVACNSDDILTERPKDIIAADNLYRNLSGFEAGLNALYANVRRERYGDANGDNNIIATVYSIGVDNGFGNYLSPPERAFQEFGVVNNSQTTITNLFFSQLYQTVNAANTIVGRAENPEVQWSAADKARVVGEARLIRAWAYRHLTYLWGDVPLNLEESSGENIRTDWERTSRDSVRGVIISDLLFAEANLPAVASVQGRASKAVAQHYLAEMYLARNDAVKAAEKASAVINSGLYRLITARYGVRASQPGVAFMDQFVDGNVNRSQGNTEVLWALQYAQNVPGGGASIMRRSWVTRYESNRGMMLSPENGGRGIGRLAITRYALNLYEPQDTRGGQFAIRRFYILNNPATLLAPAKLGDTLRTKTTAERLGIAAGPTDPLWPSTRKWDWTDPVDPTGAAQYGDQPYIRVAETYLLLAEAELKRGNSAAAAAAVNVLRVRAGATPATAAQMTLDYILDERSRELVTEEQRRYTLVRNSVWLDRTKRYNPLAAPVVAARDSLLPIPQAVIDANLTKTMPQNPGY
ncbi:MAG: RagB/SusD family nutrient uptake outer membrane protein, partial [Gemmatimonadota bacterium]|nr:RagB/SusD family nutrient uptake outer membrane protein [Gemmatimonadota bacterium]